MSTEKPRRLGRGLEALLAVRPVDGEQRSARVEAPRSALRSLPLAQIKPNPLQPRKEFVEADLRDLESSIRANGLLQPVTVRADANGKEFFLIAGERRFRAVQRLGWREIPAIVREETEVDDKSLLTLALFDRIEIAALKIFYEREREQRFIVDFGFFAHDRGDLAPTKSLHCTKATLAGDEKKIF